MLVPDSPIAILEEVVIAGGKIKRHRSLPGAQCLRDGEVLVAFRSGTDKFVTDDGAVMLVRSMDNGRTWSDPLALLAEPGWDCHGSGRLVQLDNETLLMLVGKARWLRDQIDTIDVLQTHATVHPAGTMPSTGRGGETRREFLCHVIRSRDGGHTWSGLGPSIKLFQAWTEPYARRAVKLSDGRLMIGFHGSDRIDTPTCSGVAFSQDSGETWADFVPIARAPEIHFYEVELLKLASGAILALIRTNYPAPYDCYQSISFDEGSTWTPPQRTGFSGHCPFLLSLNPSTILCAYRDLAPGRPGVSVSVSHDDGRSWSWVGQLYKAPNLDCAFPSLLRLSNGQLFCVFYTSFVDGNSEIHGLFLEDCSGG